MSACLVLKLRYMGVNDKCRFVFSFSRGTFKMCDLKSTTIQFRVGLSSPVLALERSISCEGHGLPGMYWQQHSFTSIPFSSLRVKSPDAYFLPVARINCEQNKWTYVGSYCKCTANGHTWGHFVFLNYCEFHVRTCCSVIENTSVTSDSTYTFSWNNCVVKMGKKISMPTPLPTLHRRRQRWHWKAMGNNKIECNVREREHMVFTVRRTLFRNYMACQFEATTYDERLFAPSFSFCVLCGSVSVNCCATQDHSGNQFLQEIECEDCGTPIANDQFSPSWRPELDGATTTKKRVLNGL